jgi:hypothetical protein
MTQMNQSLRSPVLPSEPIHHSPQRCLRLLRPRWQLLTLALFDITSHHATLLRSLRWRSICWSLWRRCIRSSLWCSILRHLHTLLARIHFRRPLRRKIARWRLAVVHWWWLCIRRALLLRVRLLAWGVVALRLSVKGEVVLGDLAVAFAFGVGNEELGCVSNAFCRKEIMVWRGIRTR